MCTFLAPLNGLTSVGFTITCTTNATYNGKKTLILQVKQTKFSFHEKNTKLIVVISLSLETVKSSYYSFSVVVTGYLTCLFICVYLFLQLIYLFNPFIDDLPFTHVFIPLIL